MEEEYDRDDNKRRANREKHGIDFTAVYDFDWATASVEQDLRHSEFRFVAYGYIGVRLHVVVYTDRGVRTRIISLRQADPGEVRRYEQE